MKQLNLNNKKLNIEIVLNLSLLIAALILWIINLGELPLRDWDEGYYAIAAKEMYRSGNWLYPTLNGNPFMDKPPLVFWLIASSYSLWGITEFTTRLGPAFLSACTVPLLYLVARSLFPQRLPAIFSALVYLTLLPVVRHGRLAMFDGITVFWFLLMLLCLLKARHDKRWALGVGISFGLLGLTKGILALLLGTIAILFMLSDRQKNLFTSLYLWLGIFIGIIPLISWYVAQGQHYGIGFYKAHFLSQSFDRILQSLDNHNGPPWYYILEIIKYSFPWLIFLPGGFYLAWKNRHLSWSRLVLIGAIAFLVIISVMGTKLPWYVMPIYPFLALAVGAQLAHMWESKKNYHPVFAAILSFLAVIGAGGCIYISWTDREPIFILIAVIIGISFGLSAWFLKQQNRKFILILFSGFYLVLALLMASKLWLWELNEAFAVKPVASLIREHTPTGAKIYTSFSYGRPSLDFYSDRPVIAANSSTLKQLWSQTPYLLLDNDTLKTLNLPNSKILGSALDFTLITPK